MLGVRFGIRKFCKKIKIPLSNIHIFNQDKTSQIYGIFLLWLFRKYFVKSTTLSNDWIFQNHKVYVNCSECGKMTKILSLKQDWNTVSDPWPRKLKKRLEMFWTESKLTMTRNDLKSPYNDFTEFDKTHTNELKLCDYTTWMRLKQRIVFIDKSIYSAKTCFIQSKL